MSSVPPDTDSGPLLDDAYEAWASHVDAVGASLVEVAPNFQVRVGWHEAAKEAGLRSVADVLARSTCIRDLRDRTNRRLNLGGRLVHVKHRKRRWWQWRGANNREAGGLLLAQMAKLPVPTVVFVGHDRTSGVVCGTLDLAPARPLDDLLREDALAPNVRRDVGSRLADVVALLHELGLHHRDLYLNHVYVDPAAEDPLVAIIDWDRWASHRRDFSRWEVKDVAALLASVPDGTTTDDERRRFLVRYLLGRNRTYDDVARRFARRVARKAARMRAHAPKTSVEWLAPPESEAR